METVNEGALWRHFERMFYKVSYMTLTEMECPSISEYISNPLRASPKGIILNASSGKALNPEIAIIILIQVLPNVLYWRGNIRTNTLRFSFRYSLCLHTSKVFELYCTTFTPCME